MSLQGYIEGAIGERQAVEYLEDKGYKIIATNYKNKLGEIDIIAKFKSYIVFVEVKERQNAKHGRPSEFVTYSKQRKVKNTALAYLKYNKLLDCNVRFDVVEIMGENINHIENAF